MRWELRNCADVQARRLADRHYSRKKVGARQFVGPGRKVILVTADGRALWASRWQRPEYVQHAWPHTWECVIFRNEARELYLSSELIREAVAVTRYLCGEAPPQGMVTFIDEKKVRRKRDPGRCFLKAGFRRLKERTKDKNLAVLQMLPGEMPPPEVPRGWLFPGGAAGD